MVYHVSVSPATRDVIVDAPKLHSGVDLIVEDLERFARPSPKSLMECVRCGTFPQPPLRLDSTSASQRPVAEQWIARSLPVRVICEGCGQVAEMLGLTASGELNTRLRPRNPRLWSVKLVCRLLRTDAK